jgi:hypothetical protein
MALVLSLIRRFKETAVDLVVPFLRIWLDLKCFLPIVGHWVRFPPVTIRVVASDKSGFPHWLWHGYRVYREYQPPAQSGT